MGSPPRVSSHVFTVYKSPNKVSESLVRVNYHETGSGLCTSTLFLTPIIQIKLIVTFKFVSASCNAKESEDQRFPDTIKREALPCTSLEFQLIIHESV